MVETAEAEGRETLRQTPISSHLYAGEHARGGHAEVQVSDHLRRGRLVDLRRPTAGKVVCEAERRQKV